VARTRIACSPLVVEFTTHRVGPHSKGDDLRPPEDVLRAQDNDWYRLYAAEFPRQFHLMDERLRSLVAKIAAQVEARPLSIWRVTCPPSA
jgi:pyruvate dehydrogenase E1 component alpha subunit